MFKERFLAVILALTLCMGLTGTAMAGTEKNTDDPYPVTNGNIYLSYNEGNAEEPEDPSGYFVSSCDDTVTEAVIPASVDGKPVVGVFIYAFQGLASLKSVTVPESVLTMGAYVFFDCTNLKNVTILAKIPYIDDDMFFCCTALESVTIPASVMSIGSEVFGECPNLKNVFYSGSEEDWKRITIEEGNEALDSAVIHYHTISVSPTVPPPHDPPTSFTPKAASPTAANVLVNGEKKSFDAYNIDGSNYFKLRDLAYVLSGTEKQFEVGWDGVANAISLTTGSAYTAVGGEMSAGSTKLQNAIPSTSEVQLDGAEITLTAYNIGGNNYFKLRDIGQTLDFGIGWDSATSTITIDTTAGYTPD